MALVPHTTGPIEVTCETNVGAARRAVLDMARRMGFPSSSLDDLAIAVGELATNLVKHQTIRGKIEAYPISDGPRSGMEIVSADDGPGIADVFTAEIDGMSTRGTLGSGLGAVKRLTDHCDIRSSPEGGTRIVCRKWLPLGILFEPVAMDVSVRTRCYPGECACGDQYFVDQGQGLFTVGVIDGVGHGLHACRAATLALQHLKNNFKKPLIEVFEGVDRACQGTRGAAMTLARIDTLKRIYTYAGVGNVSLRVTTQQGSSSGVITPGTLGVTVRKIRAYEEPWVPGSTLFVYSDGLSDRWRNEDWCELQSQKVQFVSEIVFQRHARPDDDATLVVAR